MFHPGRRWRQPNLLASFLINLQWLLLLPSILAAPNATLLSNTLLDSRGIYFVSYDGLVNVNSFQISSLITYGEYQYVAWYSSNKYTMIARRRLVPLDGDAGSDVKKGAEEWEKLQLPHQLSTSDSHNVISLGVSPQDGRIHVGLDCHSTVMFYFVSSAGLATNASNTWSASQFGSAQRTMGGLNLGSQVTYPQFVLATNGKLQLSYRTGVSGNGQAAIAEYDGSAWSVVGPYASSSGSYSTNGVSSPNRNLYINGFTYHATRLHISGTWREGNARVSCNTGGLSNHDTVYIYSDDSGRSWKNQGGSSVGSTRTSPVGVNAQGIIVDPLEPDHGLMNQESQAVDSAGLLHVIISYVPGRFGQCVSNYASDRKSNGRVFHLFKSSNASTTWTKDELPWALNSVGRSQVIMDAQDNAWVVLPFVRVVVATKAGGYKDWTMVFDGTSGSTGLGAFGEVVLDRTKVTTGEGGSSVLSVLYQKSSSGTSPSEVRVMEFLLSR